MYFTSIKQDGQVLTLSGIAQTNERVSELLRNTAYNAEWLTRPELVEIKATNLADRFDADRNACSTSRCAFRSSGRRTQQPPTPVPAAGKPARQPAAKKS